jgi:hypothetical protein
VAGAILQLPNPPNPLRRSVTLPTLTGGLSLKGAVPVTVRITDDRVKDVSCLSATKGSLRCSAREGATVVATLPAGSNPVAVIQADLPKP